MALQLRRGFESRRPEFVFAEGELIYVLDTKMLWVGDGETAGGNLVTNSSVGGGEPGAVSSVAGKTGDVILVKADITDFSDGDYATSAQGLLAQSALQDITSESIGSLSDVDLTGVVDNKILVWSGDRFIIADAPAGSGAVNSVAGKTGDVTLVKADITDFSDGDYATSAQGTLAASAIQPGDNVSGLTNDAGYLTSSDSIDAATLDGMSSTDFATAAQGDNADSALQPDDNISRLTNDVGYITSADGGDAATLDGLDSTAFATAAQGTTADSAVQPNDNVSDLTNDAGYITLAQVPGDLVTSVSGKTGDVVLVKDDVGLDKVSNTPPNELPISDATQLALDGKLNTTLKGQVNGLAELDANGVVPSNQLPSYVDDVVEVADFDSLPVTGEPSKIYITVDDNKTYRWTGTVYAQIGSNGGLELGNTQYTAHRGDHGVIAYNHSQETGNPHGTAIADISGLQTALNDKVDDSQVLTDVPANAVFTDTVYVHPVTHEISDISGLQTALNDKVDDSQVLTDVPANAVFTDTVYVHPVTHEISDISGLQTALNDKVDDSQVLTDVPADAVFTDTVYVHPITHDISEVDGLQSALDAKVDGGQIGVSNGIAELDENGVVPSTQLPSYVDDVVEVADFDSLPVTGEPSKIYITIDTNKTYRWTGSVYAEISSSGGLELGGTQYTAHRGDHGVIAYTHSQATGNPHGTIISEINGLQDALDGKVDDGQVLTDVPADAVFTDTVYTHPATHEISEVNGLQTALEGKVDDGQVLTDVPADAVFTDTVYTHPATHEISEINGLQTALEGKVDDAQVLTDVPAGAIFTDTVYTHPATHEISEINGLQTALDGKVNDSLVGVSNGIAELDSSGFVPASQLPSYVDDILEFDDLVSLPVTGEAGKIYVTLDNNKIYRWSGTIYVEVSAGGGVELGDTEFTAHRGDHGVIAYDHSQATGNPHGTAVSDISGLQDALDDKVDDSQVLTDVPANAVFTDTVYVHPITHEISDISGLQTALNDKVDDSQVLTDVPANAVFTDTVYVHPITHEISDISGLQTALNDKVDDSQVLTDVPANAVFTDTVYVHPITHEISDVSGLQTALEGKVDDGQVLTDVPANAVFTDTVYVHPITHDISEVDGLQTALDGKLNTSLKGTNNGLAELDENGFVPSTQLPSYVDDILEYANFSALPATGEAGKVYLTTDNNKVYRWSGSVYVEISSSLALGDTSESAHRGDHGVIAYNHSQETGNPHGTIISEINGLQDALDGKVDDGQVLTDVPADAVFTDTVYTHPATHEISEINGLQTALEGKVDDGQVLTDVPADAVFTDTVYTHPATHEISEINGLQTALEGKVDDGQVLTDVPAGAVFTDTVYTHPATHEISEINGLDTALSGKLNTVSGTQDKFVVVDSDGIQVVSSEYDSTSFATATQGSLASTALQDITGESIGSLLDVDITGAVDDKILKWSGSGFVIADPPAGGGGGAANLSELTDVEADVTSSAVDGDVLTYSSGTGTWTSTAPTGGGGGSTDSRRVEWVRIEYTTGGLIGIGGTPTTDGLTWSSGVDNVTIDTPNDNNTNLVISLYFNNSDIKTPPAIFQYYGFVSHATEGKYVRADAAYQSSAGVIMRAPNTNIDVLTPDPPFMGNFGDGYKLEGFDVQKAYTRAVGVDTPPTFGRTHAYLVLGW